MKLAAYSLNGIAALGILKGERILPLGGIIPNAPTLMVDLIAGWDRYKPQIDAAEMTDTGLKLSSVRLLAPVDRPQKIMAIGLNYADHIAETGATKPELPLWFSKQVNTVNDPFGDVQMPKVSNQIDYEAEMVAVIGKRGRHISKADAPNHVFGYCVGNDVSVRDWQRHTPQWVVGKSFDTHGPFGPWITTADEVGEPHRLGIRALVNGETRQNSNTKNLVFSVWDQIEYLSQAMTLEPGDIIYTGTPGGVGMAMKPQTYLKAGDRVRIEIDELGAIESLMVSEE